jgi:hypothetical protein
LGRPVLSIGIWYLPNLVFGRNVKTRPNWEATIIWLTVGRSTAPEA